MEKTMENAMGGATCDCCAKGGAACGVNGCGCGCHSCGDCCGSACAGGAGCCRACDRFKGLCRIHKIFKFVFGLLVFLALLKFVCGDSRMGWHDGSNMMYGGRAGMMMVCKGDTCPMMKERMMPGMMGSGMSGTMMFNKRIERRSMWDRWFGDSDDKVVTTEVAATGTAQ